jgi:hypothetical protein
VLQGASLFFLHDLEQQLLTDFGVTRLSDLQLPGGATTLLGLLAQNDELASAVTGHWDVVDVGPVRYEAVVGVAAQALTNLRHSARAQQQLHAQGRWFCCCLLSVAPKCK